MAQARSELHVVTTGNQTMETVSQIAGGIHPWMDAIHIREKTATAGQIIEWIGRLTKAGVPLGKIIVNDRADAAAAAEVKGVHLAYHSLDIRSARRISSGLAVGKSVHSLEEALQAEADGASYVYFGHIFATSSKPGVPARGLNALAEVARRLAIPVIAIGGIEPEKAKAVIEAGARGIAVMSGVMEAECPLGRIRKYAAAIRGEG